MKHCSCHHHDEHCDHHHDHHHHHHHHHTGFDPALARRFVLAIAINIVFVGSEFFLANKFDSAGLLADAAHNLGDVGGLFISLMAFLLLKKSPDKHFTYAYKRATVLAAFINALVLLTAIVVIVWECINKFRSGVDASGGAIMATATTGILVNGFTVLLLSKGKNSDLNIKSAYLHMLADTLVSLGVVISGAAIMFTGWAMIDPIVGLVIAFLIAAGSRELFIESSKLMLDGVPGNINTEKLLEDLETHNNIEAIFHLHIRALSTTENSLTAHIILKDHTVQETTRLQIKELLKKHNITHSTLEFEQKEYNGATQCGC